MQDIYILASMMFLGLVCSWHAVCSLIVAQYGEEITKVADYIALACLAVIYVGFHITLIIKVQVMVSAT